MTGLVNRLPTGAPTYRRMASSALVAIVLNCKAPDTQAEWLINKLLGECMGLTLGHSCCIYLRFNCTLHMPSLSSVFLAGQP